jgi:hypothetical protein
MTASPVAVYWDIPQLKTMSKKITFPLTPQDSEITFTCVLNDLLQACALATFRHNGKDVLKDGYSKAGKLDRTQFSTDFHPHDYGIIDVISQLLLPEFRGSYLEGREEHRGVLAKLYKLNVSLSI